MQKRAGQQGKLLLLLPMIEKKEIKTAIHVACTYLKQYSLFGIYSVTFESHIVARGYNDNLSVTASNY